ncbi:MAG: hypothetical protein JWR07_5196 [Nevskia sp.]|nr:hypothetical protein [Nevskia sp.]
MRFMLPREPCLLSTPSDTILPAVQGGLPE